MNNQKGTDSTILIITDDQRIARHLHSVLDKEPKRAKPNSIGPFFFTARMDGKKYIILSTNGHLQVFQNSSIYKWSGIDPKKIIEDENSVIPVLNSFNKKNYYALQKVLQTECIGDVILALTPDINGLTIGLKEIRNVLQKAHFDKPAKKLLLYTLDPDAILDQLAHAQPFSFDDEKRAEIENLRSYLDAVISFSITQEVTYTIKRCLNLASPAFKELREILARDSKESKNLLIPMSRAQALILLLIHENNKQMASTQPTTEEGPRAVIARLVQPGGVRVEVPIDDILLPDARSTDIFLDSMKGEKYIRIKGVMSTEILIPPPGAFDLTGLIEQVSAETDFPTTYTYKILVDLYHSRFISYPNPERTAQYFITLDNARLLKELAAVDEFEDIAKAAIEQQANSMDPMKKTQSGAIESGIYPIMVEGKNSPFFKVRPNHWKIFSIITRRYLLRFFKPARITETRLAIDLKGYPGATIKTFKVIDEGFTSHCKEGYLSSYKSISFDVLKSLEIESFSTPLKARPRAFYTDGSLLHEIKDYNLGDTVSCLLMIEKLVANNYIQVVNKNLKLTKRGELIADFLRETFSFLGNLEFSTFFMQKIQAIAATSSPSEMQAAIATARKAILDEYMVQFLQSRERTNDYLLKQGINLSIGSEKAYDIDQKRRFTTAPELHLFCPCGSPMKVIETKSKTRFLACENRLGCGKTAALPREGKITVIDKTCKICSKNVLKIESAERGTYFFCPICWMESFSMANGESIGYCATCDARNTCWTADTAAGSEELFSALITQHENGFEKCPRCQKSRMVFAYGVQEGATGRLVCENPLCNFSLDVPRSFSGKMQRTAKKCLICPMNAVLVTIKEGSSFHVCINCYNQHLKRKDEQIGF
ncbi:MAG: DNA topoisomerase, partial [Candidatus Sigynarchaeum springense]